LGGVGFEQLRSALGGSLASGARLVGEHAGAELARRRQGVGARTRWQEARELDIKRQRFQHLMQVQEVGFRARMNLPCQVRRLTRSIATRLSGSWLAENNMFDLAV
jgi:hypothetical protein